MIKKILLACALTLTACGTKEIPGPETPKVAAVEKKLVWNDIGAVTIKKAQLQRKLMVVWFYDESCPVCLAMRGGALSDPCVVDELNNHYVFAGANVTQDPGLSLFLEEKVFPSTMFVLPDDEATSVGVIPGNIPAKKLCAVLKDVNAEFQKQLKKIDDAAGKF